MADEAFRTFAVDAPYAAQTIRTTLMKRYGELAEQIIAGYAKDWPDYRERVGVMRGLIEAVEICNDMEKKEQE